MEKLYNYNYTRDPGYYDLITGVFNAVIWRFRAENMKDYSFPRDFFRDFSREFVFPLAESYPILYIAIIFTIVRYLFEYLVCKPLCNNLKFNNISDRNKFPESLWKTIVYLILWNYCAYLLIYSGKYDYFYNVTDIWDDWEVGMSVPFDITLLYFAQCGFYLHSVYATLFMDTWRKDFHIMLIHHFVTMALIIVSYGARFHKIGLLVLFVHDITDIFLESAKCNVYLKNRNGTYYPLYEHLANIGFGIFTVTWYIFRLYWFPLKVLYSTGVVASIRADQRGAQLYAFFNILLWTLMILNLYWFLIIVKFVVKLLTGQVKEANDTRDYDVDISKKKEK